jgi:EamA domain-containing membrane protein RarD
LLDVLLGVILTDNPVTSTHVFAVVEVNVSVFSVLTTCKTLPAGSLAAAIVPVS